MKIAQQNPFRTIKSVTNRVCDFIATTYGPAGKKILVVKSAYDVKAVDDGHLGLQDFELENEFEQAIVEYIREVTQKTNGRVGDGTTTSVILARAIVDIVLGASEVENPLYKDKQPVYEAQARELMLALKEAVAAIKEQKKDIKTEKELYSIAYNSFNNEEIAKLISSTIFSIGKDGVLAIEDSQTMQTEVEMVQGLEIQKGFVSPYFINTDKETAVLQNPQILLVNRRLELFNEVVPLLKPIVEKSKEIVIMAEGFGSDFLNNMIVSKMRGFFSPILIETPGFGEQKIDVLKDIAAATGGQVLDPSVGMKLTDPVQLGTCKKVIAHKDKTVFMGGQEAKERVSELKTQLDRVTAAFEKERLTKRIASLTGGIAVIKVGAYTENEQKSIKAKVDDAVNATKIAFQGGIVPGAGRMFEKIKTSSEILNQALKAPRKQLEDNGAQFLDEKVFDPAGVLIAALESAVSIASGLITMGGIITTKREKKED